MKQKNHLQYDKWLYVCVYVLYFQWAFDLKLVKSMAHYAYTVAFFIIIRPFKMTRNHFIFLLKISEIHLKIMTTNKFKYINEIK